MPYELIGEGYCMTTISSLHGGLQIQQDQYTGRLAFTNVLTDRNIGYKVWYVEDLVDYDLDPDGDESFEDVVPVVEFELEPGQTQLEDIFGEFVVRTAVRKDTVQELEEEGVSEDLIEKVQTLVDRTGDDSYLEFDWHFRMNVLEGDGSEDDGLSLTVVKIINVPAGELGELLNLLTTQARPTDAPPTDAPSSVEPEEDFGKQAVS